MKQIRFSLLLLLLILLTPALHAQDKRSTFEAIATSSTQIHLYWSVRTGLRTSEILRDGVTLKTLLPNATEFVDTDAKPGQIYRYTLVRRREDESKDLSDYTERTFAEFPNKSATFDVVIAQASSGGVAAAIEAGRRGLKVALIEPTSRLGGMPVNGLCASDIRRDENQSGFFVKFRKRVIQLYAEEGIKSDGRKYEPRIAHRAMKSLLYETPNITVFRQTRLVWGKVKTQPVLDHPERKRVVSVEVEELDERGEPTKRRAALKAKFFIDATDCGDLAAWAGAPFRIGREPRSEAEPHNGVIYYDRQNKVPLPGSTGKGDLRLQSYAYLLVVKDYGAGQDKSIAPPPGYKVEDYAEANLPTWKSTWAVTDGAMPGGKYELNQHPKGGDLQEINYRYPTGGYAERKRVEARYRQRVLGYLFYIQTGYGMKSIGLPDDEFRDNGGMPSLLYAREGRRILGEQLPTEADITNATKFTRPEGIGLGDYPMDSHAVRRKTDNDPRHMGEGEWWLYAVTPAHSLPFGVMVPRTLDNVFVTTAVSSTHVSYGTYRMEPVRMAFGEAAGVAVSIGVKYGLTGREIPARQVQEALLPRPSNEWGDPEIIVHKFSDLKPDAKFYGAIQLMAARGFLPDGDKFNPDAPTTVGELGRWLTLLAERSGVPKPFHLILPNKENSASITREDFARGLFPFLRTRPLENRRKYLYSDVPPALRAAVEALSQYNIAADLWDEAAPDPITNTIRFRAEAPISHTDAIFSLYLGQIGVGPFFYDHPLDRRTDSLREQDRNFRESNP